MSHSSKKHALRKFFRFVLIYGFTRTFSKALGRLRLGFRVQPRWKNNRKVAIIGCGQFSFSTIAFFLKSRASIIYCFDTNNNAAKSFGRIYGAHSSSMRSQIFDDAGVEIVYVASNHASHTDYALAALTASKRVYVEKPVAVSLPQLASLHRAAQEHVGRIFAGYNRPFSGAVRDLHTWLPAPSGPLTLSCFISGHRIPADHWYRDPAEGTRICGNVGHWLDLAAPIQTGTIAAASMAAGEGLRVCFLSRIARKKNLDFALRALARVRNRVHFRIYGPREDQEYWNECEGLIGVLPENVRVTYEGPVQAERVVEALSENDLFFFPTRGENFGHVFVEAWSAGLPVLTSDQTPWRNLQGEGVGWDLPLNDVDVFARALDEAAAWDEGQRANRRAFAIDFALRQLCDDEAVEDNRRMFLKVIREGNGV